MTIFVFIRKIVKINLIGGAIFTSLFHFQLSELTNPQSHYFHFYYLFANYRRRVSTKTDFKLHTYSEEFTIYSSFSLITWKLLKSSTGSTAKTNYAQKESLYLSMIVFISQYDMSLEWQFTLASYKIWNFQNLKIKYFSKQWGEIKLVRK